MDRHETMPQPTLPKHARPTSVLPAVALLALAACASRDKETQRAQSTPAPEAGRLALDEIFEVDPKLRLATSVRGWMPGGSSYLAAQLDPESKKKALFVVDAASGKAKPFADVEKLETAFASADGVTPDAAKSWAARTSFEMTDDRTGLLINERSDLYFHRLGGPRAVRLTHDERQEVGEKLSPDGRLVAYVADWNLHVAPVDGGAQPRALTTAGNENLLHGRLDWVYQEEVYGRGEFGAFWWSPDSRRIAYLVIDESRVPEYVVTDHRETHPKNERWRYPKAGDPNPVATLHVVDVASAASVAVDLTPWNTEEYLIVRVDWTPDSSEVVFQVQNRVQTWLDLAVADPSSGAARTLFRDQTPAWIEPEGGPYWIDGGSRFLWLSERDGFSHIYLYERTGELVRRVTEGPWEIDAFERVDERAGAVYFACDKDDVKGSQLYRCKLDGTGLERITKEPGRHSITFSPDGEWFLDSFSSAREFPRLSLHKADGSLVREIERVDAAPALREGFVAPEFVKVKARDGVELEAAMIKPPSFDSKKRYPVVCHVYAGPHAPKVVDAMPGSYLDLLFHTMLAQQGYLVWILDNRSSLGRGLDGSMCVYHDLGARENADIEDGVRWLVDKGFADPARIALWGWSYGGYQTAYSMTHTQLFKCGIVGAPVTDWRLYDSIYTERYMGLPQQNEAGYKSSSVLESAATLHGKPLLIHGVIDENVHMQNTLQLAERLQMAGKEFEMMLYPGNRHGISNPTQNRHKYLTMAQFLRDNL
jgi:dipeptidyl-peptidase 4